LKPKPDVLSKFAR